MTATSSLPFALYIITLSTTILVLLSYLGSFTWMFSPRKEPNFLRESLVVLHKSSSDIDQWQAIHDLSGPSFQDLAIKACSTYCFTTETFIHLLIYRSMIPTTTRTFCFLSRNLLGQQRVAFEL
jgi:hypothetical protein